MIRLSWLQFRAQAVTAAATLAAAAVILVATSPHRGVNAGFYHWLYMDGSTFLGPEPQACVSGSNNACNTALARLHLRQMVTYQPASRYWAFQWTETGLYLLLALLLTGLCIWRINRRLTR